MQYLRGFRRQKSTENTLRNSVQNPESEKCVREGNLSTKEIIKLWDIRWCYPIDYSFFLVI